MMNPLKRACASQLRLSPARGVVAGAVMALAAVGVATPARMTAAQSTVEFVVADTVKIGKAAMLVVTSGSTSKKELGNCGSGPFPVQNAVVMMPDGGAPPKRLVAGFSPLGQPAAAGTRLVAITGGDVCGPGYRRFKGTVK